MIERRHFGDAAGLHPRPATWKAPPELPGRHH